MLMANDEKNTDLMNKAKEVLANNFHNGHTIPADGMYPHQWLWDSCFIAIGLAHYDVERAQKEILNLLKGQWTNGMVPHMVLDSGLKYINDRDLWRSYTSPYSPDDIATSGITQPPLIAEAVVRIGKKLSKEDRRAWYTKTYPHIVAYHKWLYRDRDPKNEGLVLLFHPWETGLDSTPPWMKELHEKHMPMWVKGVRSLKIDHLINIIRRDARYVKLGQRLTTLDALLLYSLSRRLRHKGYSNQKALKSNLPKIEDAGFNAIFIRANTHLKQIATYLGRELPESLQTDIKNTENAYEELWDDVSKQYFSYNINTGQNIGVSSISTFLALYSGKISKDHAEKLVEHLKDPHTFGLRFPVPSVPKNSKWFDAQNYWQGPTWINTNWLIADGLKRYGYKEIADEIVSNSIKLVEKSGFYEYFSPLDGSPAGSKSFSWTAALIVDMLSTKN